MGASLAEDSALVNVTPEGTMRVMARNTTTRDELVARAESLISAHNILVSQTGQTQATELSCWVNDGMRPGRAQSGSGRARAVSRQALSVPDRENTTDDKQAAERLCGDIQDPNVRKALTSLHLAALRRSRQTATRQTSKGVEK